jgi:hypothetical protein
VPETTFRNIRQRASLKRSAASGGQMRGFFPEDDHAGDFVDCHVGDIHGYDWFAVLHHARPFAEFHNVVDVVLDQEVAQTLGLEFLGRLGSRRLNREEQRIVLKATRKPRMVNWPIWWTELSD